MSEQIHSSSEKFSFQKIIKGLTGRSEIVRLPDCPGDPEYHLTPKSDTVCMDDCYCLYLMGTHELVSVALEECPYKVYLDYEEMLPGVYHSIGADMVKIRTEQLSVETETIGFIRLNIMTSGGGIYTEERQFRMVPERGMIPTAVFLPTEVSVNTGDSHPARIGITPEHCADMELDYEVKGEKIVGVSIRKGLVTFTGKKAGDVWVRFFPKGFPHIDVNCHVKVREHCNARIDAVFQKDGDPKAMWMQIDSAEKFDFSFAVLIEYSFSRGTQYIIVDTPYKQNVYHSNEKVPLVEVMEKLKIIRTIRRPRDLRISLTLLEYDKERFTVWPEQPQFATPCWWVTKR